MGDLCPHRSAASLHAISNFYNCMAKVIVFLLMRVFTRPAFEMLLNPRLFSLLILELFSSLFHANLVLAIVNWLQLQLREFKTVV